MISWLTRQNTDVYHAIASFTVGVPGTSRTGRPIIKAERKQANVHSIRALIIDMDVARPGDGKDPAKVFADRGAALDWLVKFSTDASMPLPNLVVNSGYGFHCYWLMEDPLAPDAWQPMANALKGAILAHGWAGDTAPTVDSARILRPPGSWNFKDKANPVPVEVVDAFTADYYGNNILATALDPWMAGQATGTHGGGGTRRGSVHTLGPRPAHIPEDDKGAGLNEAAHQGVERPEYYYRLIAARCPQAEKSLAEGGNGDSRDLWKLGNHTLLTHCADGADYVHKVSEKDPRYTHAENERVWEETKAEVAGKGLGPPLCASFDSYRRGICQGCRHQGKIKTPLFLGVDDNELPWGYRRTVKGITPCIEAKNKLTDVWSLVVWGDLHTPVLDELAPGGHQLTCTYALDADRVITIKGHDAAENRSALLTSLERQGVSVDRHTVGLAGDLIVAWINKLRAQRSVRLDRLRPWGWNHGIDGKRIGCAVAGDLYRADGTEERVPGGDPKVAAMYKPVGDLANWRKAAALFEGGRADLQTLIACTFASPLVALSGDVRGMSINFWSTESGIGKTTAIKVAHSVWGDAKAMQSMRDTPNHVMRSLSEPRFLTRFWDELQVKPSTQDDFIQLIFTIPQGKERGRLHSDTTMRETGEWECLMAFTSNRSMQDFLLAHDDATDSALARLFELPMEKTVTSFDPAAGPLIKLCENNYGHAGRIYAKWLAANMDQVQAKLTNMMAAFTGALNVQQEERFFVCAMATIMVGAGCAKKLGLFNFDLQGIHKCLVDAFMVLREQRVQQTTSGPTGGYNLEEVFGRYAYHQMDWRLRTREFAAQGSGAIKVIDRPRNNTVRFQIAETPKLMRINRQEFYTWLRDNNYPGVTIVDQAKKKLGALVHRKNLGGGTEYGGSQIWVLDVPLTGDLAGLLNPPATMSGGASSPGKSSGPRTAPGARLAGNQARV